MGSWLDGRWTDGWMDGLINGWLEDRLVSG